MSNKSFEATLAEIVKAISTNKKILEEIKKENRVISEVVNNVYQRTEDMSKKFDEVWKNTKSIVSAKHKKIEELTNLKSAILKQELQSEAA